MKRINETFTDSEHSQLSQVKGDRTWHEAMLEEFGVRNDS